MKNLHQPDQLACSQTTPICCSLQRFKGMQQNRRGGQESPVSVIPHAGYITSQPSSSCTSMEHELRRPHGYSTSEEDNSFSGLQEVCLEVDSTELNRPIHSLSLDLTTSRAEKMDLKYKSPSSKSYGELKEAASQGAACPDHTARRDVEGWELCLDNADTNAEIANSYTDREGQMKQKHNCRRFKRIYPEKAAEGPKKRYGSAPTFMSQGSPSLHFAGDYQVIQIESCTRPRLRPCTAQNHLLLHPYKHSFMKPFPSKWDDAEKWLKNVKQVHNPGTKSPRLTEAKSLIDDFSNMSFHEEAIQALSLSLRKESYADDPLLVSSDEHGDKDTTRRDDVRVQGYSSFMKDAATEMSPTRSRRDTGTQITPLGSSATSLCNSPIKHSSPARHNTPARRSFSWSNPIQLDFLELQRCHLAKLEFKDLPAGSRIGSFERSSAHWSSREEEDDESFRYLRHADMLETRNKGIEARATAWEQAERSKCIAKCIREETKIDAWENHQKAKAEADLRKLEVKLERLRRDATEKIMNKVSMAEKKAEEMRAAARAQQEEQIAKAAERGKHIRRTGHFPPPFGSVCFVPLS